LEKEEPVIIEAMMTKIGPEKEESVIIKGIKTKQLDAPRAKPNTSLRQPGPSCSPLMASFAILQGN